ncbi:MAG: hypothetical protein C0434_07030 [Xanthomonadaceae bacterium]|nr:hypothetical protein [Xanthomonadaceae bacterium]
MRLDRSRFAAALIAAGCAAATGPALAASDADTDTAAVIQELKRRIEALERQLATPPAAPASAPAAGPAPAVAAAAPAAPVAAVNGNGGDFKLAWGGYVKADAIVSRYSDAPVAQSLGRDAYIPNSVPVMADAVENARTYTDLHAKETRLYLRGSGLMYGHKVAINAEFDFISGQLGQGIGGAPNEAVTNAYNPAFRLGYIDFDNFRIGQDWTTLQNLVALPDIVDLINWPGEGTVFGRQAMIRYTWGPLAVALENTESTVAAFGGNSFTVTDDNTLPDLVWRYTLKTTRWGDYTLSGAVRQISDRGTIGGSNDTALGYGLSFAGKVPLWGQDDLRFTFSGGDGFGRYLALNTVGDAIVDARGKLQTVEIYNGFVAWRHPWNDQWRSNLALSAFHANTGQAASGSMFGSAVSRNVRSITLNLLYSPIPKITFGAEYRYARRDTVGDLSGDLSRLQFSARYNF